MRHVNPNMIQPVLDGIAAAEARLDLDFFEQQQQVLVDEQPAVERHTGRFVPAKRIAFAQGYIGAYRSACSKGAS
jgi:hypothetical protein